MREVRPQQLDGDFAIQAQIDSCSDLTHSAATQRLAESVAARDQIVRVSRKHHDQGTGRTGAVGREERFRSTVAGDVVLDFTIGIDGIRVFMQLLGIRKAGRSRQLLLVTAYHQAESFDTLRAFLANPTLRRR